MKKTLLIKRKGDWTLPLMIVILAVIGTVFIYSASNYSANKTYGDSFYFVKKQVVGIAIGSVAMIFMGLYDYKKLKKITFKHLTNRFLYAKIMLLRCGMG